MSLNKKIKTYTILTGTTLGIMHIVNRFVYHISTFNDILHDKAELYYNSKFGRIYYTKQGTGSPLLLIHDLNASSSSYEWNKVIKQLSETNTVYTIDLLGCGRSDKPNLTYTNYLYVQLITEFINNVIGENTDIVATGQSASIALMTCVNNVAAIGKVILINPDYLNPSSKIPAKLSKLCKNVLCTPIIGTFIYNIFFNKVMIEQTFRTYYYYNQSNIKDKDINAYFEASHKHKTQSKYLYASLISGYTDANLSNVLNKISNSIYIITGNGNPENESNAKEYQKLLPSIEILGIDKAKHLPQLEAPNKFIEVISKIVI